MTKHIGRRICMLAFTFLLSMSINAGSAQAFISTSDYYSLLEKYRLGSGTTTTAPAPTNQNPTPEPNPTLAPAPALDAASEPDNATQPTAPAQGTLTSPTGTPSGTTSRTDYYSRLLNSRNNYYRNYPANSNPGTGNTSPGGNTETTPPVDNNTTPSGNTETTPPPVNNTTPGGNTGTTPTPATNPGDTGSMSASEKQMLDLVNQERAKAGLPAFTVDSRLVQLARQKSQDMYENNYFSHNSPTYGSPYNMEKQAGINYRVMGAENIAKASSVTRAHELLMNSEGHRANILDSRHNVIGIGIVSTSAGVYVTQLFAGN